MTNQSTIDKLIEMRLTAMADAFRIQMDDPTMKEVPFEDRFGMLVDIEYSNRKNNRLKRLIRQAEFEQPDASIAAIDYQSGRKLNKALISRLATCEYITEYRNIFITGATGSGKTYMACAFAGRRVRSRSGDHHGHRRPRHFCGGRVGKAPELHGAGSGAHQACQQQAAGRAVGAVCR